MKDFIALQKRARELEHRLQKLQRVQRRIVKEWETLKQQLAEMLYEEKK